MDLDKVKQDLLAQVNGADTPEKLEEARVAILGKKGALTAQMKQLGGMTPDERKVAGPALNMAKQEVTALIEEKANAFQNEELNKKLETEKLDITLSARPKKEGKIHPISQTIDEMIAIFGDMGFNLAEGPDIESVFNNFDALNMPACHPAREKTDTFYMPNQDDQEMVLRCHTSPVQVRTMKSQQPPIRVVCPGKAYRNDSDATHSPMFHQIEGLWIDEKATMTNLKWSLEEFAKKFFEMDKLPIRFRPHCFPFTEPSMEADMSYSIKDGNFKLGEGDKWLEVFACGMVHPKVLENCGIDSSKYQGFAFGFGVDRLAMLKYGMSDIRPFWEADSRWLDNYGFSFCQEPNLTLGKK